MFSTQKAGVEEYTCSLEGTVETFLSVTDKINTHPKMSYRC